MPLPKDAQGVLARIHDDNQREIELGRLAQQKAQNPAVKQFAQTMVQDHQALDQQVQQMAKQQNIKLGKVKPADDVERKMQAANKAQMEKLQALSGMAFDHAYMTHMVEDHDNAIMLTQGAMQTIQDPQLTQMLQQSLPAFQKHRQQAYQILGQLGQQHMGVGGGGMQHEQMQQHEMQQREMQEREMQQSPMGNE